MMIRASGRHQRTMTTYDYNSKATTIRRSIGHQTMMRFTMMIMMMFLTLCYGTEEETTTTPLTNNNGISSDTTAVDLANHQYGEIISCGG